MKHNENSRFYEADDGKLIVRISDGKIMGDGICLGDNDSIDNYEEREFTADERAAFWESIGMGDPKIKSESPKRTNHKTEGSNE